MLIHNELDHLSRKETDHLIKSLEIEIPDSRSNLSLLRKLLRHKPLQICQLVACIFVNRVAQVDVMVVSTSTTV